jgi:transcriptional regulator with XRE-family HTH domain
MKSPHPHDVLVGRNIRLRRQAKRISQTDLAKHLGLTFQQVQKYEKGTNKIGAGRLITVAKVLEVHVASFFDGAKVTGHVHEPMHLLDKRDAFKLIEAFSKVESQRTRNALVALVQGLTEEE